MKNLNKQGIVSKNYRPTCPDRKEILELLGYKASKKGISSRIITEVEAAAQRALTLAEPVAVYRKVQDIELAGWEFLSLCKSGVYIAAVTIGPALEKEVERLTSRNMLTAAVILDAAGSVAVEKAADMVDGEIGDLITSGGYVKHLRASPGYGGFPLEDQVFFFSHLPCRELGLSLTEGLMLSPCKSTTFAVATGREALNLRARLLCSNCKIDTCTRRSRENGAGCFSE